MNVLFALLLAFFIGCTPVYADELDPLATYTVDVSSYSVNQIAAAVLDEILEYQPDVPTYDVDFVTNVSSISLGSQTVSSWYDIDFTVGDYLGYEFQGFYFDAQHTIPVSIDSGEMNADVTIYVLFERIPKISFVDAFGDTFSDCYATDINLPVIVPPENYTFTGWYYDEAATSIFSVDDEILADLTLYSGYEYHPLVTFHSDFDAFEPVRYTDEFVLPFVPNPAGYVFLGWYYDEAASSKYKDTDVFVDDTDLYAVYVEQATPSEIFGKLLDSLTLLFENDVFKYLIAISFLVLLIGFFRLLLPRL